MTPVTPTMLMLQIMLMLIKLYNTNLLFLPLVPLRSLNMVKPLSSVTYKTMFPIKGNLMISEVINDITQSH